jgi:5-keto-L-gluconate epimerase
MAMKYSLCLSTNPARFDAVPFKGDLAKNVKTIADLGFDGVELAIRDPNLLDKKALLSILRDSGLAVPAIGTGQAWSEERLSFSDPDPTVRKRAVARVISHLEFAHDTKATVIIGLLRGVSRHDVTAADASEWMFEAFSRCCEEALTAGVRIAFEPINRYETSLINSVGEGLAFIDKVGLTNLGMLLDTFHMNIEEASIEEIIRAAGKRMFHFQQNVPGSGSYRLQVHPAGASADRL